MKNHISVNFHAKNFVILSFFVIISVPWHPCWRCSAHKSYTWHCGLYQILVLHQRLSIHLDALRRRDTYGRLLTFVIRCYECYRYKHIRASARYEHTKFSWSKVKSRNSQKYRATKIWSYMVFMMIHMELITSTCSNMQRHCHGCIYYRVR